jgi:hypothetical protein
MIELMSGVKQMTTVKSSGFGKITGIGTRNTENRVAPKGNRSKRVEVSVTQDRRNTPINVEILVPITRSECGSRRVAALSLNGSQARALYNTLTEFFEHENQNTQAWERQSSDLVREPT